MKKILTILIIILSVFLIYLGFKDKKVYYLSIGDYLANGINEYGIKGYSYSNYISDYLNENNLLEVFVSHTNNNMRVIDVMNDINNNSIITVNDKSKTFQNALIKADLITISLGMNDLFSNVSFNNDFTLNNLYEKLDKMLLDYDNLFSLLRQYCKENIVFIGIYNPVNEDLDDFDSLFDDAEDLDEPVITEEDNTKNELQPIVDNASVTNKRFEIDQFLKYFSLLDDKTYEIVGIFSKTTRKCAAMAILNFNYLNENDCYCCEVQALQSGKGYGKTLLESIAAQFKHFWFMANVDAGEKLVNLYKAMPHFNELHVFPSIYDDNEHPERKGLHLFYTKDMPSSAV